MLEAKPVPAAATPHAADALQATAVATADHIRRCRSRAAARSTSTTSTRADAVRSATSFGNSESPTRSGLHPVGPGHPDEIDRLRCGEQRLELGQLVLGQIREDPAARRCRRRRKSPGPAPHRAVRWCRGGSRGRRTTRRQGRCPRRIPPRRPRSTRSRRCRSRRGSARTRRPVRGVMHHSRARTGRLDATTSVPPSGTAAATSRAMRPSHAMSMSTTASIAARARRSTSSQSANQRSSIGAPALALPESSSAANRAVSAARARPDRRRRDRRPCDEDRATRRRDRPARSGSCRATRS